MANNYWTTTILEFDERKEEWEKLDGNTKALYIMMFSLQTLHNQGITIKETVYKSLENLLLWNEQSGDEKCLELALLHMQAYVNMGFALDDQNKTIREILKKTEKTKEEFFPKGYFMGKKIKLNKSQVRSMIGKWKYSRYCPMTVGELVDDIIKKVKKHEEGRYIYQYQRADVAAKEDIEVYELVINKDESYFYDVKKFRFYTFMEE